jgi:uncharacterized protein YcfJ
VSIVEWFNPVTGFILGAVIGGILGTYFQKYFGTFLIARAIIRTLFGQWCKNQRPG